MALKIYFLSSEIAPFAEQYGLAEFSRQIPTYLNENDHDIRLIMPKYGFISSRKYVLREVIRLQDIEAKWKNEVVTANVRSAFIPETKVQAYFLDLPAYFEDVTHLLYKAKNGRPLKDNVDRFGLFTKIALRTLEKLYWQPDVIVANDWAAAFAIPLQKLVFSREDFFSSARTVFVLHSLDEHIRFSGEALRDAGISPRRLQMDLSGETRLIELAAALADEVVLVNTPGKNMEKAVEDDQRMSEILAEREQPPKTVSVDEDTQEEWQKAAGAFETTLAEFVA